jgi:DNA helicase HerA-like ATPase
VPFALDAGGFDRHTFFCGQSGSGKSYSLGVVLEQLLLETRLQIVILDPNSDMTRLREVRPGVDDAVAERWRALAGGIDVRSGSGERRLCLRLREVGREAQAAMLRLDPVADREEHAELDALLEDEDPSSLEELMGAARPQARPLALRVRNLGIDRWGVWARESGESAVAALGSARCLALDLGSLESREQQALVSAAVLGTLWERRAERRPVLIVIDEAHNVCPSEPADALTALATEHAVRIAAEGRKFGLYLLVCTQRPQKVQENIVSQCDNLVLMRMASAADLAHIGSLLSFAPRGLLEGATAFRLGEALVAGKLASHPALIRFGRRVAEEGGGDVEASWASAS